MATFKSAAITMLESATADLLDPGGSESVVRCRVEAVAIDDVVEDDLLRYFRVHSRDIPLFILFHSDLLGVTAEFDFGLHDVNDGSVVDVDFFGASVAMDAVHNSTPLQLPGFVQPAGVEPLWTQLGLGEDPNLYYDFSVTATTLADDLSGLSPIPIQYYYTEGGN